LRWILHTPMTRVTGGRNVASSSRGEVKKIVKKHEGNLIKEVQVKELLTSLIKLRRQWEKDLLKKLKELRT